MTTTQTAAAVKVLATVDRKGAAYMSTRTNPSENIVHAGAARALVRSGVLEEFLSGDGAYVRRVTPPAANPVGRMIERNERAVRDVARYSEWLDTHDSDHGDFDYMYRQLRRARRRVTRTRKAYLRLDLAIYGENVHARAALDAIDGRVI